MELEQGRLFEYKCTSEEEGEELTFHAIVEVTNSIAGMCNALVVFDNSLGWRREGLFLESCFIEREVSQEDDPEYFL